MAQSMRDNRSMKRIVILKRIGRVSKVLPRIPGLLSAIRPLGLLQSCVRGFLKRIIRRPVPFPNRQISCARTSQRDLNLHIGSPKSSTESRLYSSPTCPESIICPPGAEDQTSPTYPPKRVLFNQSGVHRKEGFSACPRDTSAGNPDHSMGGNSLQVDLCCSQSPQSQSCPLRRRLRSISRRASHESSNREILDREIKGILMDAGLGHDHGKFSTKVYRSVDRFLTSQQVEAKKEIARFELEASFLLKQKEKVQLELQTARQQMQQQHDQIGTLTSTVTDLRGRISQGHECSAKTLNADTVLLERICQERKSCVKHIQFLNATVAELEKISLEHESCANNIQSLKRTVAELQRISVEHESCANNIQSLNATVAELRRISREHESCANNIQSLNSTVAELRMISREHEASVRTRSPEPYAQRNAICGSYEDEAATPRVLHDALSEAKKSVRRFQKSFVDAIKLKGDGASLENLMYPEVFFARPSHIGSFAARAAVCEAFFEGFENESFNTCLGVTKFLDPDIRKVKFYEYYLHERQQNDIGGIGDPQFQTFCETKVYLLWEKFNLRYESNTKGMKMSHLEELGGPQLVSAFRAAAKNIWLFHKLAFSFQPPASIFRVEQRAIVDTNYMHLMVNLDDHKRFVHEVGFMITPGFRIGNSVLPCEVYLAGAS